jgi:hypothetical protein
MVDSVLSGYKAEAQAVVFSGTRTLISLADNEFTHLSDEIDNSVNRYMMMDLRMVLGSAVFTGTDSAIEIYLVPSIDGTNYPDWVGDGTSDEQENNKHFVGSMTTSGDTSVQDMSYRSVAFPNGKFKFGVRSRAGVALAGSGSTLYWRPWGYSSL